MVRKHSSENILRLISGQQFEFSLNLTIVIPTLNEVRYLARTIHAVRRNRVLSHPLEIIVADCGSADGTVELAKRLGVTTIQGQPHWDSRATALNQGAARASEEVLLFLHADSLVPCGFDQAIHKALQKPQVVGGAFQFALDGSSLNFRWVEALNRYRYRLWPDYYGDQGLFVWRGVFHQLGGYPHRGIMEDAYFCRKLRAQGQVVLLNQFLKTSPRRFVEGGIFRVVALDAMIWILDQLDGPTESFAQAYRKNNQLRGG